MIKNKLRFFVVTRKTTAIKNSVNGYLIVCQIWVQKHFVAKKFFEVYGFLASFFNFNQT